jgi:hypothetical protein
MGKYMSPKELIKRDDEDLHTFRVKINIHGRRHTEYYTISHEELDLAKDLGLFFEKNGYVDYFDWKPIADIEQENLHGGVKKVLNKFETDKHFVVVTDDDNIYTIPKYLRSKLPSEDFILFGKRKNKRKKNGSHR